MAKSETHYELPAPSFAKPPKLLIVVSPYYKDITDQMLAGARTAIEAVGGSHETVEVPGALEVPIAIRIAASRGSYDGFVALGCVIRGETSHYDTVCNDSSRGLALLGLDGLCLGNGILTVENREQAVVRAEAAGQNKGGGAANAALHLIALTEKLTHQTKGIGFKPNADNIIIADNGEGKQSA